MTSLRRQSDVMVLSRYLETMQRELATAAAVGGDEVIRAADLLTSAIESSGRLCLLEALSDAAAEITTKLGSATVEVRLRGREAQFVVAQFGAEQLAANQRDVTPPVADSSPPAGAEVEGDIARITLRIPESLKEAVETAAA